MAFGFGGFPDMSQMAMRSLGVSGPNLAQQAANAAYPVMGGGASSQPPQMGQGQQPGQGPMGSTQTAAPSAPPGTGATPGAGAAAGEGSYASGADAAGIEDLLAAIFGA